VPGRFIAVGASPLAEPSTPPPGRARTHHANPEIRFVPAKRQNPGGGSEATRPGLSVVTIADNGRNWNPPQEAGLVDPDDLERLISPHRFATYLADVGGDRERAVALYHWTGKLAGAWTEDLRCLEIIFRNTVHNALTAHHSALGNRAAGVAWFDNPKWVKHHWWNAAAQTSLDDARRRAGHLPPSFPKPDAVVAELGFGFWRYVVSARYEQSFWVPVLDAVFAAVPAPTAARRRERLEANVKVLHKLRNRIAHHEPIFKPTTFYGSGVVYSAADQSEMLFEVLDWIDPGLATWARSNSSVGALLARRP
jgi:hypothetical protein